MDNKQVNHLYQINSSLVQEWKDANDSVSIPREGESSIYAKRFVT